jgi:hypothetical protein
MHRALCLALVALLALNATAQHEPDTQSLPGSRTIMDAHNCYPYYEWWHDRIDRALSAGTPLAIEQDLYWYTDTKTGNSWSIVAHGVPISGREPTMEHYFFDRVRPKAKRTIREVHERGMAGLTTLSLLRSGEKDRLHHSLNFRGHLLSGDAVGVLKPATRRSKDGPGGRAEHQSQILCAFETDRLRPRVSW